MGKMGCDACRTINLAKNIQEPHVDIQVAEKCIPHKPCIRVTELPLHPTCIKVCTREEYKFERGGKKLPPAPIPHIGHGKIAYCVKAGVLVGAIYFTYRQGIWGDQQDLTECLKRWEEHIRSFHTRRPPVFDKCGNVVYKPKGDGLLLPAYMVYKGIVTTCCAGIVKFPTIMRCMYYDYTVAMRNLEDFKQKERQMKRLKKAEEEKKRAMQL